jgi:hypothetical protein
VSVQIIAIFLGAFLGAFLGILLVNLCPRFWRWFMCLGDYDLSDNPDA